MGTGYIAMDDDDGEKELYGPVPERGDLLVTWLFGVCLLLLGVERDRLYIEHRQPSNTLADLLSLPSLYLWTIGAIAVYWWFLFALSLVPPFFSPRFSRSCFPFYLFIYFFLFCFCLEICDLLVFEGAVFASRGGHFLRGRFYFYSVWPIRDDVSACLSNVSFLFSFFRPEKSYLCIYVCTSLIYFGVQRSAWLGDAQQSNAPGRTEPMLLYYANKYILTATKINEFSLMIMIKTKNKKGETFVHRVMANVFF